MLALVVLGESTVKVLKMLALVVPLAGTSTIKVLKMLALVVPPLPHVRADGED